MDLPPPEPGDAFRMLKDGETIVIEFGRIVSGPARTEETSVAVTDRVALSLDVGRRLLHTLNASLRPHEADLRAAQARALSPAEAGPAARPGQAVSRPPPDRSGEQAAKLLRLVGAWGIPHQYERSFRISERSLRSNRFLLTVNASDIPGDARDGTLAICDQMGMPAAQRIAAAANFAMASSIHFGFEGDADNIICKLYLERSVPATEARRAHAMAEPVMLHLSYKWSLTRDEAVTTKYLWHPLLNADEIVNRLKRLYGSGSEESRALATEFLYLATAKVEAEKLQYLEVEEVENDRRSFDLNVYNAKLQVKDCQAQLQRMRSHFGLRPGQFQAVYDQIRSMSLGHLAGGLHRNGRDFFNLYYGVVSLPTFNRRLRDG